MSSIAIAYELGAELARHEFSKEAGLPDALSKALFEAELKILSKIPPTKHIDVFKGVKSLADATPGRMLDSPPSQSELQKDLQD